MFLNKLYFISAFTLVSTIDKSFVSSVSFIVSDGAALYNMVNSNRTKIINTQHHDIVGFDHCHGGASYFTIKSSEIVNSVDSSTFPSISQPEKWQPTDVAVDCWNEKVYFIDELAATINVHEITKKKSDILKSHFTIVLADLNKPTNLVVNPIAAVMFFVQASSAIYRAGLDGSRLTKIIEKNGITSIAVDPASEDKNLYWTLVDGTIEVANYQGRNSKILGKVSSTISGLAVSKNFIAWTTPATWNSDGYVYVSDNLADSSNVNVNSIRYKYSNFRNPKIIKVKQDKSVWSNLPKHPCAHSGCQHMCLLNTDKQIVCACRIGWQLKKDSSSCEPIEEFVLYVQGNLIRGKNLNLNKESFTEAILPIHINGPNKAVFSFDYDFPSSTFVYSNTSGIYHESVISRNNGVETKAVGNMKFVAVDWMAGNIYFAGNLNMNDPSNFNTVKFFVVYNHRLNKELSISRRAGSAYPNLDTEHLKSLAIHPMRGYLFYTDQNGIFRMNTDFKEKQQISKADDCANPDIDIDYASDRLYWLCNRHVKSINLSGGELKTIELSYNIQDPRFIKVYQDWIFIGNLTSIWRFDKRTGKEPTCVAPKYENGFMKRISGVKIFSPSIQTVNPKHPCAVNNGGCAQICYGVPSANSNGLQRVCACDSDFVSVGTLCI